MVSVLGFDLGSKTGYSLVRDGVVEAIGGWQYEGPMSRTLKKEQFGERWIQFLHFFEPLIQDFVNSYRDLRYIGLEQSFHRGYKASRYQSGFETVALILTAKMSLEEIFVPPASLKLWATGYGRADKEQMFNALRDRVDLSEDDLRALDDNMVDATWVALYTYDQVKGLPF